MLIAAVHFVKLCITCLYPVGNYVLSNSMALGCASEY